MIVLMIDNDDDQPFSSRSSAWMTRGVSKAFEFSGRNDSYWSRQNRGALSFTSFTLFVCVLVFDYNGDDDRDGNDDFYESNGDCDLITSSTVFLLPRPLSSRASTVR